MRDRFGSVSGVATVRPVALTGLAICVVLVAWAAPAAAQTDADGDSFLQSARYATLVWDLARLALVTGSMVAIGGLTVSLFVLRDDRDTVPVLRLTQFGGSLVAIGAVVAVAASIAVTNERWSAMWSPDQVRSALDRNAILALALRAVGGTLVVRGADPYPLLARPSSKLRQAIIRGTGGYEAAFNRTESGETVKADLPPYLRRSLRWGRVVSLFGVVGIVAAFSFDGETLTTGPRIPHIVANALHVLTAGMWGGGVLMLSMLFFRWRRAPDRHRLAIDATRFSVVALASLVLTGAAGFLLVVFVGDGIGAMFSGAWGQLVLIKVAAVVAAGAAGIYNRQVLLPEVEADAAAMEAGNSTTNAWRTAGIVLGLEALGIFAAIAATSFLVTTSV